MAETTELSSAGRGDIASRRDSAAELKPPKEGWPPRRARARAARLKREALAMAPAEDENVPEGWRRSGKTPKTGDDYDDGECRRPGGRTVAASWRFGGQVATKTVHDALYVVVIICGFTGLSGYIVWQHHEATERQ